MPSDRVEEMARKATDRLADRCLLKNAHEEIEAEAIIARHYRELAAELEATCQQRQICVDNLKGQLREQEAKVAPLVEAARRVVSTGRSTAEHIADIALLDIALRDYPAAGPKGCGQFIHPEGRNEPYECGEFGALCPKCRGVEDEDY